ncbi:hypothetical protein BDI4_200071 [Burkholderia diffusa]|nr:hypothetical protein BDI4_200071 [Burkholderia diffusa]
MRVRDGLPEDRGAVLEKGNDAGRRALGRRPQHRRCGARALGRRIGQHAALSAAFVSCGDVPQALKRSGAANRRVRHPDRFRAR